MFQPVLLFLLNPSVHIILNTFGLSFIFLFCHQYLNANTMFTESCILWSGATDKDVFCNYWIIC